MRGERLLPHKRKDTWTSFTSDVINKFFNEEHATFRKYIVDNIFVKTLNL